MQHNLKTIKRSELRFGSPHGAPMGNGSSGRFFFQEFAMKRCFKCGEEKPKEQFYRHPRMSDGRIGKCKECNKRDVSENYRRRREQYAEYEKTRYQEPERHTYCVSQCNLRRKRYPEQYRAYRIVRRCIRNGKLVSKPCSVCGNPKAQAHHEDYSKPLDVIWLCRKHHLELHGKMAYEF